MEREVAKLEKGALCCGWNYCAQRLAVGHVDGSLAIYDDPQTSPSFTFKARDSNIIHIVWLPPEFGDAIGCICADGTLSIWEEVAEDSQPSTWKLCKLFESSTFHILNLQFGVKVARLKMTVAYSDGHVKVYELLDPMDLSQWQLQAEFQNVINSVTRFGKSSCVAASISWSPRRGENQNSSFIVGFSSDLPQFNSPKIWEFEEAHQRWLPVAELALPGDDGDRIEALAWAPNIGRPYEVIAVASAKGITIWHVGLNPESDGGLFTEKVALLAGHDGELCQLEWDMSGTTLASTGGDNTVRLWQSNLNGVWHEQTVLECNGSQT